MAGSETQPARYFLKVISGPDEGKAARLTEDGCVLGRSDDADLVLTDPAIGFEHAVASVASGRAWIENLAAKGTLVGGRPVTGKTPLVGGDVIGLTDATEVKLEVVQDQPKKTSILVPVCLVLLLLVGVGMLIAKARAPRNQEAPVLREHWQSAFQRISRRLKLWRHKGLISRDIAELYEQAWLRELSDNDREALRLWQRVQSMMMTTHLAGAMAEDHTFASHAGPTTKTLSIVMGWDPNERPDSFQWSSDEAMADAAWWFAARRVAKLKARLERDE